MVQKFIEEQNKNLTELDRSTPTNKSTINRQIYNYLIENKEKLILKHFDSKKLEYCEDLDLESSPEMNINKKFIKKQAAYHRYMKIIKKNQASEKSEIKISSRREEEAQNDKQSK